MKNGTEVWWEHEEVGTWRKERVTATFLYWVSEGWLARIKLSNGEMRTVKVDSITPRGKGRATG